MNSAKANLPVFILALVEIVIGIMLIVNPIGFQFALIRILGIFLLIIGIVFLIRFLTAGKSNVVDRNGRPVDASPATIITAVVCLAIGAVCTFATGWIIGLISVFAIIFGVFLVIFGILKIKNYVDRKKSGYSSSPLSILGAILSVILGIIVVINPFGATNTIWTIAGIALIVTAVIDIISLIFGNGSAQFRQ